MAIYPINQPQNKNWRYLNSQSSSYSKEYAAKACDLYLQDEFIKLSDKKQHEYFRMYAKKPHTQEMALAYNVHCPHCRNLMKAIGGMINNYELYLYECPVCSK